MKQITSQKDIEQCCIKIICGDDQGTGFFVSTKLIITAYHVIMDNATGTPVVFQADKSRVNCKVLATDQELDVCILESEATRTNWLPLLSAMTQVGRQCEIAGFPNKQENHFLIYEGNIKQLLTKDRSDFSVSAKELDADFDYEGFSGGPVISSQRVTGIALRQVDNTITGISIRKMENFLQEHNIPIEEEYLYHDVPKEFHDLAASTSPNYKVYGALDASLVTEKHWIVVQGTPGSGKTTIAALFQPKNKANIVFGRYFLKIPNDSRSAAVRISPQFFLETLENLFSSVLTGELISKREISQEERLNRFNGLMEGLNSYFASKQQVGILIIDGIDEAIDIENFLAPLPAQLGSNFKIILCCAAIAKIPSKISTELDESNTVTVYPLEFLQCEALIEKELSELKLSIEIVQKLALKSEGHPLYLRYLINYLKKIYLKIPNQLKNGSRKYQLFPEISLNIMSPFGIRFIQIRPNYGF